jgi:NitT/TauT family transport system permease protein
MSTYSTTSKIAALPQSAEEGAAFATPSLPLPGSLAKNPAGVLASLAWAGFGLSCVLWQDLGDWPRTHELSIAAFVIGGGVLFTALIGRFGRGLQSRAPWLLAFGLFLTVWEVATAKFGWLPLPFFRRRRPSSRSTPTICRSC